MSKHFLTLIEYNGIELHPLVIKNNWFLSNKEVSIALNTPLSTIIDNLEALKEGKHYSYESIEYAEDKSTSSILFFSKIGIIKLSYLLKTNDALNFLEFIEDINLEEKKDEHTHTFYDDIEEILKDRLSSIKNNPKTSLEEINHFILTLDNLVKKRNNMKIEENPKSSGVSDMLETILNLSQSYLNNKAKN